MAPMAWPPAPVIRLKAEKSEPSVPPPLQQFTRPKSFLRQRLS
jgi:hypothetical protein